MSASLLDAAPAAAGDGDALRLELVPGASSLWFLFGGISGLVAGMPPFEFFRATGGAGASRVFLRDPAQAWYRLGLPGVGADLGAVAARLRRIVADSGATDVRFIGNSMGGYAALLFCGLLGHGRVVAFAPQAGLSAGLRRELRDNRWRQQVEALQAAAGPRAPLDLPELLQQRHPAIAGDIYVSSDDALDLEHARLLQRFPGLQVHVLPEGGHDVVKVLRDSGRLPALLAAGMPAGEQPSLEQPSLEEPSLEEPSLEEPSLEEPSVEEPAVEEPSAEEPSVEEPSAEALSTGEQSANEQPAEYPPAGEPPVLSLCVGLQVESFGAQEQRLWDLLAARLPAGALFLLTDEARRPMQVPEALPVVAVTRSWLQEQGLPPARRRRRVGWCRDYALYALRARVQASHYWLVDAAVVLGEAAADALFADAGEADLLVSGFAEAQPAWPWHRQGSFALDEPYDCDLALVRLSGAAIDHLQAARSELCATLREAGQLRDEWPDGGSFVATVLGNSAFQREDLRELPGVAFSFFDPGAPVPLARALAAAPDEVLYPVLGPDAFVDRLRELVAASLEASPLAELARHLAAVCGEDEIDRAERVLVRVSRNWLSDRLRMPPAGNGEPEDATGGSGEAGEAGEEDDAAAPAPPPAGGTRVVEWPFEALPLQRVVRAEVRVQPRHPGGSQVGDFRLFEHAGEMPPAGLRFAPYQLDAATASVLEVETPAEALQDPFFYQAQRSLAGWARRVPLAGWSHGTPASVDSVFVLSIGRCGSTLFSRIAAGCGFTSVSECDAFTGVPFLPGRGAQREALAGLVEALRAHVGVPPGELVLKFRAQSNVLAPLLAQVFPRARFVMLVRGVEAWSRSFIQKFGWDQARLERILLEAIRATATLRGKGIDLQVLGYEAFAGDPLRVWQLLRPGEVPDAQARERLAAVAAQESQEGAGIRDRVPPRLAEQRVADFLAHWQRVRPAGLVARLGLEGL